MKNITRGFIIGIGLLCATSSFAEPDNLDLFKRSLIRYHDSGQYDREHLRTFQKAKRYLLARAKSHSDDDKPLAIVLDIDDTCLSNYPDLAKIGFGSLTLLTSAGLAEDPALPGCVDLYDTAQENDVAVFFITGRRKNLEYATAENLKKVNITKWDGIVFKPDDYNEPSVIPYKSQARAQIAKDYDIILTIGDQYSDLKGGYADQAYKLPNPFYYLP